MQKFRNIGRDFVPFLLSGKSHVTGDEKTLLALHCTMLRYVRRSTRSRPNNSKVANLSNNVTNRKSVSFRHTKEPVNNSVAAGLFGLSFAIRIVSIRLLRWAY